MPQETPWLDTFKSRVGSRETDEDWLTTFRERVSSRQAPDAAASETGMLSGPDPSLGRALQRAARGAARSSTALTPSPPPSEEPEREELGLLEGMGRGLGRVPGLFLKGLGQTAQAGLNLAGRVGQEVLPLERLRRERTGEVGPGPAIEDLESAFRDLEGYGREWQEGFPASPSVEEGGAFQPGNWRWWTERGSEVVGQLGAQLAAGGMASSALGKVLAFAAPTATLEGGQAYRESVEKLREQGLPETEARGRAAANATLTAAGATALEAIPGSVFLLKRIPGGAERFAATLSEKIGERAAHMLRGQAAEGVQEATQEAWADLVQYARGTDPEAFGEWRERYAGAGSLGALAGGVAGAVTAPSATVQEAEEVAPAEVEREPEPEEGALRGPEVEAPEGQPSLELTPPEEPGPTAAEGGFLDVQTTTTEDEEVYSVRTSEEEEPGPLTRAIRGGRDFWQRHFTVAGDLPREVFERDVKRSARIQGELKQAEFINRDIDRALKEAGFRRGFRGLDEEGLQAVDRALKGEIEAVPENVRPEVRRARDHIDRLSRRMIEEGLVEGELEAKVRENLGTYATRSYRIFDDPDWAEKVPQKVRNRAKAWFREEIKRRDPEIAQEEILGPEAQERLESRAQGAINEILYDKYNSPLQFFAGKKGSKDLGVLKRRKDVPEPIRELMGEYRDPRVNYVRSVSNMASLLENQAFLDDVREAGFREGWLHEEPTGTFAAKLAADESSVMSPLNGLYTTPEVKRAFEENPRELEEVAGVTRWILMKPIAVTKIGKTIGSPMTHVRNFESNVLPQIANGHNPLRHWGKAAKATSAELPVVERLTQKLGADTEANRAYMLRLKELGVVDQSARAGEMRDVLQDAFGQATDLPSEATAGQVRRGVRGATQLYQAAVKRLRRFPFLSSFPSFARQVRRGVRGATQLYQAEDDFWKVVFFESERARYKEALPEATDEQLDQIAASHTRAMMPTYERVPKAVKRLRRFPFLSSFPSFYAEVIRNSYNTLQQASRELRSADPDIRKVGRRRAMGILAAGAVAPAAAAASRFLVGYGLYQGGKALTGLAGPEEEDEEEDRLAHAIGATEDADIRRFLPPWSENSTIIYLGRNEEGNLEWVDLSYTDYYAGLRKPVTAALRGEDWQESFWGAVKELASPFASEDIFVQKILDLARNKRATGGEVWNPNDTFTNQLEDALGHLWKAAQPGAVTSAERIQKGLQGEVTPYGRSYDPGREIAAVATGVRFQELDFRQAFGFRAWDRRREIRQAQQILTSVASNRGEVSAGEIRDAYRDMENRRRKAWAEAYKDARAAMRTGGLTEREVIELLDNRGFSERDAVMIARGQYVPYRPSEQFFRGLSASFRSAEAGREELENLRARADLIGRLAREQPRTMVYSEDGWVEAGARDRPEGRLRGVR